MKRVVTLIAMIVTLVSPAQAYCGSDGVYVFGAYWCPACRTTEQFMARYGINYERFEVTGNPQVQQFMTEHFGSTAIPVIVVDGTAMLGYDGDWLKDALCVR